MRPLLLSLLFTFIPDFHTSWGGCDSPHAPYTRSDADPVSPSPGGAAGVTRVPDASGFGGASPSGGRPGPGDKHGAPVPQEVAHNGQEGSGAAISDLGNAASHVGSEIPSSGRDPTAGASSIGPESRPAAERIDNREWNGVGTTSRDGAPERKEEEERTDRSPPSSRTMPPRMRRGATHAPQDAPPRTSSRPGSGTPGPTFTARASEMETRRVSKSNAVPFQVQAHPGGAMTTSTDQGRRNRADSGIPGTAPDGQSLEMDRRRTDASRLKNVLSLGHSAVYEGAATAPPTSAVNAASYRPDPGTHGTAPGDAQNVSHNGTTSLGASSQKPRSNQTAFRSDTTTVPLASTQALSSTPEDRNAVGAEASRTLGITTVPPASTPHAPTAADTRPETDPRSTQVNQGAPERAREVPNRTQTPVREEPHPVDSASPARHQDDDRDPTRSVEDLKKSTVTPGNGAGYSQSYRHASERPNPTPHAAPSSAYLATLSTTPPPGPAYPFAVSTVTSGFTSTTGSPRGTTMSPAGFPREGRTTAGLPDSQSPSTSDPPESARATAGAVPDRRPWTSGPDLPTPSPPDTHSTPLAPVNTIRPSFRTSAGSQDPETPGQTPTSIQIRVPSGAISGTARTVPTREISHSPGPGTQTFTSVTKRPPIHPGTPRPGTDWARDARVFVQEDQPAAVSVETFEVLLQVILEGDSPSSVGLMEIEPFLRRVAGYQSQQVTWHRGPAFQSVLTFRTAEAVSWLGGAESLLRWAGLRPLPAAGIFVDGVRVKNVTVGGLHGDVCSRLFSCPPGFRCVSSEGSASCRSACHSGYCKHQGICAHRPGHPPACQCPVGEDFWFMGQRCDLRMTRQRLAGACFGALVAVATLMAILAYLAVRRFKSMLAQAKAEQTQSRFNHFDELSARFWRRSDDSLENAAFSRSDELLHMRALERPCCYHDDTLSITSTSSGGAARVRTVYPRSWQYRWDVSTCSLADGVVDSGKASDLSVCSWPIEPIQWTPFPLLQQLDNTSAVKCSRSRSYCEGVELVEKSRTA